MTVGGELPLFALLRERLRVPEDLELEFKAARGGLPRSLWPTVSAFANTIGGWIILGIDEESPFEINGINEPEAMLQDFYNLVRNPQKLSSPVCGATDASIESIDGKSVIVIRVPAASRRNRPVYINGNPYDGTYVRGHTGDYHCTKPEVDRMMRDASGESSDSAILQHYTVDDLDRDTLANYRRRFQTRSPENPWNAYDDRRFLQAIRAYRRDRDTGAEGLTVAGLLLAGTEDAIRDWRGRHLIDYRLVSSEEHRDDRWDDRVAWEGNLLGAFEMLYPRLIRDLPAPFRLQGERRIDQSSVHVALREALVNLLVHADYAESEASLIRRFPEGYSFRNPGSSLVSVSDLINGDRSDPRNPDIVKMFRLIGLAEEAGSGMANIIRAWRELGFQLPMIDVGTERYEFSLELRHVHFLRDDDRAWLHSLGEDWGEAEQLALVYARHTGAIDNLTLRGLTGLHATDITRVLRGLRDRDLLQAIGGGRGTKYELSAIALSALVQTSHSLPGQLGLPIETETQFGIPGGSEPSPGDSEVSSGGKGISSGDNEVCVGSTDPSSVNVQRQLEELARPARERRRLSSDLRDSIVIALCTLKPLALHELAALMDRNEDTLRDVLRGLFATRRIAFLYPDRPSHPQQKYIAVSEASRSDAADGEQASRH